MTERASPRRGVLPAADRPETAEPVPDAPDVPGAGTDAGAGTGGDAARPVEVGGQKGPEPTRYGDWEGRGRCTDF